MLLCKKNQIEVKMHRGFFPDNIWEQVFITIKNLNTRRDVVIKSIYIEDMSQQVNVINPQRPLSFVLKPGRTWETWIQYTHVATSFPELYDKAIVLLATGRFYRSKEDKNVAPSGSVPDGSW